MKTLQPGWGLGTLVNHALEGDHPLHAHVMPIFETSSFAFEDASSGAALFKGEAQGFTYTRLGNPNLEQLAGKIAILEGIDLLRRSPELPPQDCVREWFFPPGWLPFPQPSWHSSVRVKPSSRIHPYTAPPSLCSKHWKRITGSTSILQKG